MRDQLTQERDLLESRLKKKIQEFENMLERVGSISLCLKTG